MPPNAACSLSNTRAGSNGKTRSSAAAGQEQEEEVQEPAAAAQEQAGADGYPTSGAEKTWQTP